MLIRAIGGTSGSASSPWPFHRSSPSGSMSSVKFPSLFSPFVGEKALAFFFFSLTSFRFDLYFTLTFLFCSSFYSLAVHSRRFLGWALGDKLATVVLLTGSEILRCDLLFYLLRPKGTGLSAFSELIFNVLSFPFNFLSFEWSSFPSAARPWPCVPFSGDRDFFNVLSDYLFLAAKLVF